jgi:hypothetical protein
MLIDSYDVHTKCLGIGWSHDDLNFMKDISYGFESRKWSKEVWWFSSCSIVIAGSIKYKSRGPFLTSPLVANLTPGGILTPRGEVIPWGWNSLLAHPFFWTVDSVHPWGWTKGWTFPLGDNVHPWGQTMSLKTGFRGLMQLENCKWIAKFGSLWSYI